MINVHINDLGANEVKLFNEALLAQKNSFAPYSGYKVGAAILDETGEIHSGCNVENVIYLAAHAEGSAITAMINNCGKRIAAVCCVTIDAGTSCGYCRQLIWEHCDNDVTVPIYLFDENGNGMMTTIGELLPYAFELKH